MDDDIDIESDEFAADLFETQRAITISLKAFVIMHKVADKNPLPSDVKARLDDDIEEIFRLARKKYETIAPDEHRDAFIKATYYMLKWFGGLANDVTGKKIFKITDGDLEIP